MLDNVLEVWSAPGSISASANVQSSELSTDQVQTITVTLRRLMEKGVRRIVVGFGRVKTLSADAIDTLNRFHEDISTAEVRLSLFGLNGQPEALVQSIKLPVYLTEEAAQKANLAQAF